MRNILKKGLDLYQIDYTEEQLDKTDQFYEMLIEKNKHMNLTRITDREDFYVKHILDSLSIVKAVDLSDKYIIDIGTGAGFPGIPIKIFYPYTKLVLLDSVNKKLNFINDVIESLSLKGIFTVHGRAEDIAHEKKYREKFDISLSRAVAELSVLSELSIPFLKVKGIFAAYKSYDSTGEIEKAKNAISFLSGSLPDVYDIVIPGTEISRKIITVEKNKATSFKYPRRAGILSKNPL